MLSDGEKICLAMNKLDKEFSSNKSLTLGESTQTNNKQKKQTLDTCLALENSFGKIARRVCDRNIARRNERIGTKRVERKSGEFNELSGALSLFIFVCAAYHP